MSYLLKQRFLSLQILRNPSKKTSLNKSNSFLSQNRANYLLFRNIGEIEKGRQAYSEAENSFRFDVKPMFISNYTQDLISKIDFNSAYKSRRKNYSYLGKKIVEYGIKVSSIPQKTAPLCFPVKHYDAQNLIKILASRGIFCPTYWPNIILPKNDIKGFDLLNKTVYLPIDQRYGKKEMDYILDNLLKII